MRLKFPNISQLGRMVVAMRQVRWRDPLTQVWGLVGGLVVVGIAAHYVRRDGASEKKNREVAAMIVSARGKWGTEWQPGIPFASAKPVMEVTATDEAGPDLRGIAASAAGRKGWQHLPAPIRQEIAARTTGVRSIAISWSGTRGGDLAALELYHDSVLGRSGELPGDFVIGNGRRSVDGRIEPTRRWFTARGDESGEVIICLTGDKPSLTAAQSEALGELITALEAGSGRIMLGGYKPAAPGLLADVD